MLRGSLLSARSAQPDSPGLQHPGCQSYMWLALTTLPSTLVLPSSLFVTVFALVGPPKATVAIMATLGDTSLRRHTLTFGAIPTRHPAMMSMAIYFDPLLANKIDPPGLV